MVTHIPRAIPLKPNGLFMSNNHSNAYKQSDVQSNIIKFEEYQPTNEHKVVC